MVALTDEEYESALDDDLGWRRVELHQLKAALNSSATLSNDSPATRGLSRALVTMCYAHWEGYTKSALERYALLVAKRKPKVSQASDALAYEHMSRLMKRVASGDNDARATLISAIRGKTDDRVRVDRALLSDTRSNLRYATLEDLFARGAVPITQFELKANLVDVLLCDRRNSVAHGRNLVIDPQDSVHLCSETLELMELMRDVMVGQVRERRYLRTSANA